jgi:two-component system cell cycle sensor histidine kinase/response regulator CckA
MRVLVVEDDAQARKALVEKLRQRGHTCVECGTAEQGLALYAGQAFPLVIVDWVLPGMDGLALCRKLRALPARGMHPVIVFATGRNGPSDLVAGLDAGADDYLFKPIEPELFETRLVIAERMVRERERRAETESALQASQLGFRSLIEGSPDGIVVHRDGNIVYLNPSLRAALDYSESALLGHAFLRLLHAEDLSKERERLKELNTSKRPTKPHEVRLLRRDGSPATFEMISIPLVFDGQASIASLLRDLTERKRMEQRLLLADRMVSMGTLVAGIAHEINNPLAYVIANLGFIREEVEQLGRPQAQANDNASGLEELVAQAEDGAERVRVIIRDLKGFSRVDASEDGLVELPHVLDGAINMAWNEIRHRATLRKHYDLVGAVHGNAARFGQVFLNLLVNAAQAIPVGHAADHVIVVAIKQRQERVVVEISDDGAGISSEVLPRIFDPFYTTKPVGVGTGLGLSICHGIITAAGGEITVESQLGKGALFRVELPVTRVRSLRPRTPPPTPVQQPATRRLRILIVDDEPSVVRALQRTLRAHDLAVAFSGHDALQLIAAAPDFDLVFCDLMMAQLSGMEVFEAVRLRYPHLQDRFVFMTGGAFSQQAKDFLSGLPNQVIDKPFDIRALHALVSQRVAA